MKQSFIQPIAAALLLCAVTQAYAQAEADTVINVADPTRVIVTENGAETTVEINGTARNPNYHFLYSVTSDTTTSQAPAISLPFVGDRMNPGVKSQCTLFNDIYFGLTVPYHAPEPMRTSYDCGIDNVIGYRYNLGRTGASLGFGIGFGTKVLITRRGMTPQRIGDAFALVPAPEGATDVHGNLTTWSFRLPVYYRQRIYRSIAFKLSAVLNYNFTSRAKTEYTIGDTHYTSKVDGLHQRLVTPDFVLTVGTTDFGGLTVRWSPVPMFKSAYGPRISTLTFGLTLAF